MSAVLDNLKDLLKYAKENQGTVGMDEIIDRIVNVLDEREQRSDTAINNIQAAERLAADGCYEVATFQVLCEMARLLVDISRKE